MASSLVAKIRAFLSSPQGQRAVAKARQTASRPENRQRLTGLLHRFRNSRRR